MSCVATGLQELPFSRSQKHSPETPRRPPGSGQWWSIAPPQYSPAEKRESCSRSVLLVAAAVPARADTARAERMRRRVQKAKLAPDTLRRYPLPITP
eukprot:scaffold24405_cov60-Phaeocystis_antarctica.AAC.3